MRSLYPDVVEDGSGRYWSKSEKSAHILKMVTEQNTKFSPNYRGNTRLFSNTLNKTLNNFRPTVSYVYCNIVQIFFSRLKYVKITLLNFVVKRASYTLIAKIFILGRYKTDFIDVNIPSRGPTNNAAGRINRRRMTCGPYNMYVYSGCSFISNQYLYLFNFATNRFA